MQIATLLSLLLTIATTTLVRAEACPVPTAEGWVAEYDIPEGSTETVCYWSQCAALGGVAGWSPTYYECLPNDLCLATRAGWCRDGGGGEYQGAKKSMFGKKRGVSAKAGGREWVA